MGSFKVLKNLSIVLKTLLLFMLLSGVQSVMAQNNNGCANPQEAGVGAAMMRASVLGKDLNISEPTYVNLISAMNSSNLTTEQKADIERAFNTGVSNCAGGSPSVSENNSNSCREADKDLNTALNDFIAACSEAGLGGDALSCGETVRSCIDAPGLRESSTPTSPTSITDSFMSGFTGQQAASAPRSVTPDLESAADRFNACPVYAGEDLENWQETIQSSQDRVDELTNKINDMQTEITELQTEKAAKLKEVKDQMTEVQEKAEDDAEEIRLQIQEFDENIATQVQKLQESITQQHQIIQQLGDAKITAYNSLMEAQTRLNLQCHAASLQKVEQVRQTKQALVEQSLYSAGGFNSLLSGVGLSNVEAAERLGQEYYERCLNDRAYKDNMAIAERAYQQAVNNADRGVSNTRKRIQQIEDQIQRVQGELKLKGLDNFARRLERLEKRLMTRMMQLQEDMILQSQSYDAKIANKQNALMQAQRQLQEAQSFLQQRQAYYDLKNQKSQGLNVTAEQRSNLFSKYGAMRTSALQTIESCGNGLGEAEKRLCRNAKKYLGPVNSELDLNECESSSTNPPPGDSNETPIGGGGSETSDGGAHGL